MKELFLLVSVFCITQLTAQNRFPELDAPATKLNKGKLVNTVNYQKLDSLYSLLPPQPWMVDEYNRHFIPNGMVIVTEDQLGDLPDLSQESYQQMRDKGINIQVIRLCLTRIGGWPGSKFKEDFFKRVDNHIFRAKENGIKTMFKLTLYDLTKESYGELKEEQWAALLNNENGTFDLYLKAWKNVFLRYKNESSVIGYDLLNEPLAGHGGGKREYPWVLFPKVFKNASYFEKNFFIPLYNTVIEELNIISPEKYALIQWWHYVPNDHRQIGLPSAPTSVGIKGRNIFYAPHYYGDNPEAMMERYLNDALHLKVPIIIPEYGAPTFNVTDNDIETQLLYKLNFIKTVDLFDRYCIGLVKAWWCGSGTLNAKLSDRTWAMFMGNSHANGSERKYLMDMVCRPRPLAIAGVVNAFHFDFATRKFTMDFKSSNNQSVSEIYLPVKRHYPDGCRIQIDDIELTITTENRMIITKNTNNRLVNMFNWDSDRQQLIVKYWPKNNNNYLMRIVPGINE